MSKVARGKKLTPQERKIIAGAVDGAKKAKSEYPYKRKGSKRKRKQSKRQRTSSKRVTVMFLEDVPEFVPPYETSKSSRYIPTVGPFRKGEVLQIPYRLYLLLKKHKLVKRVSK